ncbi:MAG: hypothetical protein CMF72_25770 [Mameliella sp.]|nr:hypothetical protein [Mameliella sp.]
MQHQAGMGTKALCRNEHLVVSLRHTRRLISAWRDGNNHHRPHTSLEELTL